MKTVLVFRMPPNHAEQPPVTLDENMAAVPLPNDEIILAGNTFTISKRTFRYFPGEIVEITLDLTFHGAPEPTNDEESNNDLSDRIAYLRSIREANKKQSEEQS